MRRIHLRVRLVAGLLSAMALCVPTSARAQRAAAGDTHTLVVASDGTAWAWGNNTYGQLGDGTTTARQTPVQVAGLTDVIAVAAGWYHSMALRADGTVWAWGYGGSGELGRGTTASSSTPVQVVALTGAVSIAAGYNHSLAALADGTAWAWGSGYYGQLGHGSTTSSTSPVQVTSLSSVTAVAAGDSFSVASRSNGTVWSWGYNSEGSLGDGTTTHRSSPVQVSGITDGVAVSAGTTHVLVLRSTGGVVAWGSNSSGKLGDGTSTQRLTPVAVNTLSSGVAHISAGGNHSMAAKSDGTLLTWGYNGYGQLATGSTSAQSTPVTVSGVSSVSDVEGGSNHSIFVSTAGVVWTAGRNSNGQLGDGSTTNRLSATAISDAGYAWNFGTPTFSHSSGTYHEPIAVTISTVISGATIRYTLDGSTPTETSPVVTGPVTVSATAVLKAKAWHPTLPTSGTGSVALTFAPTAPTFSPGGGTYASSQTVTLSTTTPGATIRYTLDGSTPTAASPAYSAPITLQQPTVLKALALKDGWSASSVASATYAFSDYVPTASASAPSGTYSQPTTTTLNLPSPPPAGTWWISWSDDGVHWYGTPSGAPIAINRTMTFRWYVEGYQPNSAFVQGPTNTRDYVIKVATPTISLSSGEHEPGTVVQLSSTTPGALFRYRLDGQTPTSGDPLVPPDGKLMVGNFTLAVRGVYGEMDPSDIATATYTIPWNYNNGALTAGASHSVALKPDGTVWTWGRNNLRQLGYGEELDGTLSMSNAAAPRAAGVTGVQSIAAGLDFTAALRQDGTVWTWGASATWALGRATCNGPTSYPLYGCSRPESVGLTNIVAIAAGSWHVLALDRDGFVWSWGDNPTGQLGDGTTAHRREPQLVAGLNNIVEIAAGQSNSYARRTDGTVWVWGANDHAQIGDGTFGGANRLSPVQIPTLTNIAALSAGSYNGYTRTADQTLWVWGEGSSGQLGFGTFSYTPDYRPAAQSGAGATAGAAGGTTHTVGVSATGALWTTGGNQYGQLGDDTTSSRATRAVVAGLPEMRAVGAGSSLSFGIGRNGSGWAWGDNTYGQVGNGATTPVLTAVEIFPAPTFNGCDLSRVTPGVVTIPAEGGSQTFTVGIAPMCTWAVTSNSAFAHPGAGRTGSGTIGVTFDVNPGPQRTAMLTFPGLTVTVTQAGGAIVPPTNEEISYFHTDAIGSVRMITNAAGAVVARYDYLPFGNEWSSSFSNVANAVKFTGQERETETAFGGWEAHDYFGARYFQSQTGRFTSVDPVVNIEKSLTNPQRWNRYAYSLNNPQRYIDPNGLEPLPAALLQFYSAVFKMDLSHVQIRTGMGATGVTRAAGAKGVTVGGEIFLAPPDAADYEQRTSVGIALVGHELLHVSQQHLLDSCVGSACIQMPGFLTKYLTEYAGGRLRGQSHFEAYQGISFEQEAFRLERRIRNFLGSSAARNREILRKLQAGQELTPDELELVRDSLGILQ